MLDLTGIVRGKLELHRQVVDVRSLLDHTMHTYCASTAAKKTSCLFGSTAAETCVEADRSRLTQVFWNLLQNACKFTTEGGAIDIRVYNESVDSEWSETATTAHRRSRATTESELSRNVAAHL